MPTLNLYCELCKILQYRYMHIFELGKRYICNPVLDGIVILPSENSVARNHILSSIRSRFMMMNLNAKVSYGSSFSLSELSNVESFSLIKAYVCSSYTKLDPNSILPCLLAKEEALYCKYLYSKNCACVFYIPRKLHQLVLKKKLEPILSQA